MVPELGSAVAYIVDSVPSPCGSAPTACADVWPRGSILVRETKPGTEKVVIKMTKGPAQTGADLGDPSVIEGTDYRVCVYDDASELVADFQIDRAAGYCAGRGCWQSIEPSGGWLYKDKNLSAYGVNRLKLQAGDEGRPKFLIKAANKAKKGLIQMPTGIAAALATSTEATVQVHGTDMPACHSVTLDAVLKATPDFFKAKLN